MTPEDRDLLLSLRRQQADLQQMLEGLNAQLSSLEARAHGPASEALPPLPPLPTEAVLPPLPPIFADAPSALELPPIPSAPGLPPLPPLPVSATKPSFEFQFGRWLMRLGALFGVIGLALIFAWPPMQKVVGHAGLLGLSAIAGIVVVMLGGRMERGGGASLLFGRTLTAMALAWLYLIAYAAYYYEPLRVINSPLVAGLLLLAWSIYVFLLAERKKSQILALFSVTLAYVSTAINPVGMFTMGADLILAATAMSFLWRNGWAALSFFSLIGTYLALLRRLVVDSGGQLVLDSSRTLPFWPHAIYLVFAWLIFTAAVILTTKPTFCGNVRRTFLSLNNAAVAALLALTAYIAGYGTSAIGWTLLDTGFVLLITSRVAGFVEIDPVDVMAAYAAQGLALVTGGVMVVYTGITRGVLLLIETLLLGVSGAFAGDRILIISTHVSAFFATLFLIWEMAANGHHPWALGFGGALVMLICAWNCRSEVRDSPAARSTIVLSSSCYCVLAIALVFTALWTELSDSALPPALALASLGFTFLIYYFSLFELPALAQILLLAAQVLVVFPEETGEELPWWSTAWVAAATLLMVTWWSRQRITRSGSWTILLNFAYGLALVDLTSQAIQPDLSTQSWMVVASFLSLAFLIYGAFTRTWAVAAAGQALLGVALFHLFFPPSAETFPWTWWAAAIPIGVTFFTASATLEWLRLFTEIPPLWRDSFRHLAHGYLALALVGLIAWVFGIVPHDGQIGVFFLLGTFILSTSVRHANAFGIRCSFIPSLIGVGLYLFNFQDHAEAMATFLNGLAMLLFLAQGPLLKHEGTALITVMESWLLTLFSVGISWIFVSAWVWTRLSPGYLTMGWALFAFFLFVFGSLARDPRLRWCGMAVVAMAILRVACHDIWKLSGGYRALTIMLLAFIALVIGYAILRRSANAERIKALET
jgi:Predicted membrane protein (DUF2339)